MAQRRINIRRAGLDETLSNLDIQVNVTKGPILVPVCSLRKKFADIAAVKLKLLLRN